MPHDNSSFSTRNSQNSEILPEQLPRAEILLVDDNAAVRGVMRCMLDREGFEVAEAGDGVQALSQLQRACFDLVITDLVMPDCDGIELIRTIKTRYPATKILAISGVGSAQVYLKTARLLGANDILAKPFTSTGLLSGVRGLLGLPQDA